MSKFKVGDKVRVTKADQRINSDGGCSNVGDYDYDESLDLTGMIVTISGMSDWVSREYPYLVTNNEIGGIVSFQGGWWVQEVEAVVVESDTISKAELLSHLENMVQATGTLDWVFHREVMAEKLIAHFNLKPKKKVRVTFEVEIGEDDRTDLLYDLVAQSTGVFKTEEI